MKKIIKQIVIFKGVRFFKNPYKIKSKIYLKNQLTYQILIYLKKIPLKSTFNSSKPHFRKNSHLQAASLLT